MENARRSLFGSFAPKENFAHCGKHVSSSGAPYFKGPSSELGGVGRSFGVGLLLGIGLTLKMVPWPLAPPSVVMP
jgi:hypothetical protein